VNEHVTDKSVEQIRFFYKGKELDNSLFVYSYEMAGDTVMSVMIRPNWLRYDYVKLI